MSDEKKVEIKLHGKVPKNAIVLEGFQGVGLVGALAAQYITDKKKAESLGYVSYSNMPPIAVLVNGEMKYPIRVYTFKTSKQAFVVFESELPIPQKDVHEIAEAIVDFAQENKAKEIVCLEGLAVQNAPIESKVFGFSNNKALPKKFAQAVNPLQNGIIIGVSAALMMHSKIMKMPAYCFIAEAHAEYPDGVAASNIIKKLNIIYGLNVDTSELERESQKFEDKLINVIKNANDASMNTEAPKKTYIG